MRKVVLISFCYPPRPEIGSLRAAGLAKYLPSFGWEPIVIAPQLPEGRRPPARVIETDYRDILGNLKSTLWLDPKRGVHQQLNLPQSEVPGLPLLHTKAMNLVKSAITYPDATKGWVPFAAKAVLDLARLERIDAIVSTSPPISAHLAAAEVTRQLECPWIVDFRDLWFGHSGTFGRSSLRRLLDRHLEKRTLRKASLLVAVSDEWAEQLRLRYPSKSVLSIMNGFDPEELPRNDGRLTDEFTITYAGNLYQGKRDPRPLFEAVRDLFAAGILSPIDVRLRFYGPIEKWIQPIVKQYGLEAVVHLEGIVPLEKSLREQQRSHILLLLGMPVANDSGCYPGKLFEYLGSERPILALGGIKGLTADLLERTRAGVHLLSVPEIRKYLTEAYTSYRQCGYVPYEGDREAISQYTRRNMAHKFAQALDSLYISPKKCDVGADGLNRRTVLNHT